MNERFHVIGQIMISFFNRPAQGFPNESVGEENSKHIIFITANIYRGHINQKSPKLVFGQINN